MLSTWQLQASWHDLDMVVGVDVVVDVVVGDVACSQRGRGGWWLWTLSTTRLGMAWCGPGSVGQFQTGCGEGIGGLVSLIWTPRGEELLTCVFVPFGKVLVENQEVEWKVD